VEEKGLAAGIEGDAPVALRGEERGVFFFSLVVVLNAAVKLFTYTQCDSKQHITETEAIHKFSNIFTSYRMSDDSVL
jgi:hypothetical protein